MFGCDKCPATFLHRYSLTRHMVAHSDVRFECEICKSLFKYKTNLKRHERNTHHIIRNTRQYITAYNVTTAAGSSSARNWIDLTGNSDVEDDPNNVRLGQNSVATKATSLQSNNQGDLTCMTFNMNSLKSERIDQIVSYTCNLNSNVCLCGYCTTLDIKSENEQNNVHIEYKPTIRMTVDSTVGEGMVIKRNSSEGMIQQTTDISRLGCSQNS
ncbi:uncharacterized protein LOC112693683 isoform X2 [Sipha flava]|uniref:Uncharacterized protein LOC112693683 isoform X2 n=1 Tax=Sipha flava TaxID=143950 RepID=A0A8B8GN19_9HEMI|nr:uncharacterized protein LOC112693683 isoform X2 [Sipha flava]